MFALADCNNFFVSCERVFRPDLEGKPVVVLSGNDGCVVSRSNEAKALGIPISNQGTGGERGSCVLLLEFLPVWRFIGPGNVHPPRAHHTL